MGRPLILEEFTVPFTATAAGGTASGPGHILPEEQRLVAFEHGYKAGWDDAVTAQSEDNGSISADLAGNLRDLSFTFQEARLHILKGVEPLVREIVKSVLPDLASQTLPDLVVERLHTFLASAVEPPIILMVAPASRAAVEAAMPQTPGFPVLIREEPTLAEGQAFLRAGLVEESIDTAAAISEIRASIEDFFSLSEGLKAHG
ncbi:hypothetical protein [Pseudoruegeria sp. SK021]|uniref:hypothetical protein n=1 Tax=Pseudoruegeria sp. SK021 TaxID=1933035 RepID=UPI000A242124|nr:hypothetical protein [Pseudoruegeria sp. SK021]OSP56807.1 hypothetical protein BV911_02365 [Pseudoruegeria sp. SK021]